MVQFFLLTLFTLVVLGNIQPSFCTLKQRGSCLYAYKSRCILMFSQVFQLNMVYMTDTANKELNSEFFNLFFDVLICTLEVLARITVITCITLIPFKSVTISLLMQSNSWKDAKMFFQWRSDNIFWWNSDCVWYKILCRYTFRKETSWWKTRSTPHLSSAWMYDNF